jgi:hypothetical protein
MKYLSDDDAFLVGYYSNFLARRGKRVTCPYCDYEETKGRNHTSVQCLQFYDGVVQASRLNANDIHTLIIPTHVKIKYL